MFFQCWTSLAASALMISERCPCFLHSLSDSASSVTFFSPCCSLLLSVSFCFNQIDLRLVRIEKYKGAPVASHNEDTRERQRSAQTGVDNPCVLSSSVNWNHAQLHTLSTNSPTLCLCRTWIFVFELKMRVDAPTHRHTKRVLSVYYCVCILIALPCFWCHMLILMKSTRGFDLAMAASERSSECDKVQELKMYWCPALFSVQFEAVACFL